VGRRVSDEPASPAVSSIELEFGRAKLGDKRRTKRLVKLARACSAAPDRSFPEIAGSRGQLEAFYRFFGNDSVQYEAILAAHVEETALRAAEAAEALCVHDTSEVTFAADAPRKGLRRLRTESQGFLLHESLCLRADGSRRPLGTLALKPWVRDLPKDRKRSGPAYEATTESNRWLEQVEAAETAVAGSTQLIHVMDAEADAFPLLAALVERGRRFITRITKDRVVIDDGERVHLSDSFTDARVRFKLEIPLSRRKASVSPRSAAGHGSREAREATVAFTVKRLTFPRPENCPARRAPQKRIELNVIHIYEIDPPAGAEPVDWTLATIEPVATIEQIKTVVEHYRARWTIEEFFRALKSGCAFERRQLESYSTLLNALVIFLPIAWQLLLLRTTARTTPAAPAVEVLTPIQIEVLRAKSSAKLGPRPSAREALLAVAALGGHLKNNGEPGWIVLSRGMEKLIVLTEGWTAHLAETSG
jgi:Transposase DNA-binding/Transposase DDE domain